VANGLKRDANGVGGVGNALRKLTGDVSRMLTEECHGIGRWMPNSWE